MRRFMVCKGYEDKGVVLPKRATSMSAGYDLVSLIDVDIKPNEQVMIPTGLKVQMEKDEVLLVFPRSSLAVKRGLRLSNSVAVIDADYFSNPTNDGHIMINLFNFSSKTAHVGKGERFAQGIFTKYLTVDDDESTSKREGGYGSTGAK